MIAPKGSHPSIFRVPELFPENSLAAHLSISGPKKMIATKRNAKTRSIRNGIWVRSDESLTANLQGKWVQRGIVYPIS